MNQLANAAKLQAGDRIVYYKGGELIEDIIVCQKICKMQELIILLKNKDLNSNDDIIK